MSTRHFDNPYPDLAVKDDSIEIDYRLWRKRIRKLVESILRKEAVSPSPKEGGIYIGTSGVAFMMWYLASKFPEYSELKEKARYNNISIYLNNLRRIFKS